MSLKATSLFIQMAPIPATFRGNPNALAAEMIRRMKILSPNGTNFIFIGDNEPTSNVGPWLKGGTQWFVWDDNIKRYVPLDISASLTRPFFIGKNTPASSTPPVWLRTTSDATDTAPNNFGEPLGWYVFDGTNWVPFNSVPNFGTTAERPASPIELQQYYDTDIAVLIWWERGAWRTVDGVPNDIKFVGFNSISDALTRNPGWALFGAGNQSFRGRGLVQAAANSDGSNTLTTDAGVPVHKAFETFGENTGIQVNNASPVVYPPGIALWCLIKL